MPQTGLKKNIFKKKNYFNITIIFKQWRKKISFNKEVTRTCPSCWRTWWMRTNRNLGHDGNWRGVVHPVSFHAKTCAAPSLGRVPVGGSRDFLNNFIYAIRRKVEIKLSLTTTVKWVRATVWYFTWPTWKKRNNHKSTFPSLIKKKKRKKMHEKKKTKGASIN